MPLFNPSGSGTVTGVTAADTSIVIGGTAAAPTVATGTLDVIAADHPAAANWSNNSHKITSLLNGSSAQDAAAFGQIPVTATTTTAGIVLQPAASASFKPANTTGINQTTVVMQGLGGTVTYTPTGSGKVIVDLIGVLSTPVAAVSATIGGRYGTGTAPTGPLSVTVASGTGAAAQFSATQSYAVAKPVLVAGTTQPGNFSQGTTYYVASSPAPSGSAFYLVTANDGSGSAIAFSTSGAGVTVAPPSTGTTFGPTSDAQVRSQNASSTSGSSFSITDRLALTANTAYWFDVAMATGTAADTCQLIYLAVTVQELLS